MKSRVQHDHQLITIIQLVIIFLGLFVLGGCRYQPEQRKENEKLLIVTTTGMIKDAVEQVAGDRATVVALMGPGVDPHLYKATQGDLKKLTDANIIFYNGLHLEGKMGEVFEKLGRLKTVVAVADGIPDSLLRKVPGFQGAYDPHIWFDVKLWKHAVNTITEVLQREDSSNTGEYQENSQQYLKQLDSLDDAVAKTIRQISAEQRVLITAHDAFGYFGDAYDVEVRGLQGISTLSEFGLKDRVDLIELIINRKIKAIFIETSVPERAIKAVVEGCREKGWDVAIGGTLFSDAMGNEGTKEGTYIGMVNANVMTIVSALK